MRCTGGAALQGGQPTCSGAPQESRGRCRGEIEPSAASTDVPRARVGAASDCKSLLCRFEQFGAAAFETRPASWGGLRGARRELGRGTPQRPDRAGLALVPLRDKASAVFHAEADEHSSLYLREEATGPLTAGSLAKERSRGSPRGQPHTWTGHAVAANRDDDQGPTAAQVCPHHNMYNSLPRRTGQRRGLLGPRRVRRARLERYRRDLYL